MHVGTMSLVCLLFVSGQVPDDIFFTNQRSHRISVKIDPSRRAEISEIRLFYSNNQGRDWHLTGKIPATQDSFVFHAETDGYYWFQHAIVTKDGKQDPEDLYKSLPSQKMVIDTIKPVIRITSAQRVNGELVISWDIKESYSDPTTMKLEYHGDDQAADVWQPINTPPAPNGTAKARMTSGSPVVVRLSLKDLAGNFSVAQTPVAGENGLMPASFGTAAPAINAAVTTPGVPPVVAPPLVPPATPVQIPAAVAEVKTTVPPAQTSITTPPVPPTPIASTQTPQVVPPVVPPALTDRMNTPPAHWQAGTTGTTLPTQQVPTGGLGSQVVARSDGGPAQNPAALCQGTGTHRMPPVQIVNDREVMLDYEVKAGPSGIGRVELWVTRDGGKSWQTYGDRDLKNDGVPSTHGKNQRTLTLPEDGVYGLYMIVRNSVGLGKPEPKPGDLPEMLIEVDTTLPKAELYAPQVVPGQRDTVLLQWTAKDRNLTANPITLEWAEKQSGPWHVIGHADMPNAGSYAWKLPPQIPSHVFLRLQAKDTAGNVGVAESQQPQLVDLSVPDGQLLMVRPVPR